MLWQRGRAYAQDLRERGFRSLGRGSACRPDRGDAVCQRLLIFKGLGRRRKTGETTARPQRCHVPRTLTGQFDAIRAQVAAHLDATLEDLRA